MLAAVDLREYPGAVPGALIAVVLALAVARWQNDDRRVQSGVAALLLLAAGLVLSVTLTPSGEALAGAATHRLVTCDVSRFTPLTPAALSRLTDESLNVYLFIPLGIAVAFLPASRWRLLCGLAAILLPIVIETIQAVIPALGRVCQSGDVVDNWTGLALGLAMGASAHALWRTIATRSKAN